MQYKLCSYDTLVVCIAGNDMLTNAFTQIIDYLEIAGSSTMLEVPNVELSPGD